MSSKARGLADLGNAFDDGALSNRNLIINGAMQVHQRGGTASISSAVNTYLIDRFRLQITNSATIGLDCSQSTDAPDGFDYSLKLDVTTAYTPTGGVNVGLVYPMERQDAASLAWGSSDVPKFTVSFWVKSNKTGDYSLQLMNNGGSTTNLTTYTINSASTWERKTVTFNGCPTSLSSGDTAERVRVIWHLATGPDDVVDTHDWDSSTIYQGATGAVNFLDSTSNELYITGVQLEVGDTATPFEHRSYGDELAKCQRYFQKIGTGTSAYKRFAVCYSWATGGLSTNALMPLPVQLRSLPSLSTVGTFAAYHGNASISTVSGITFETAGSSLDVASLQVATTGLVRGDIAFLIGNNDSSAAILLDAEL